MTTRFHIALLLLSAVYVASPVEARVKESDTIKSLENKTVEVMRSKLRTTPSLRTTIPTSLPSALNTPPSSTAM